MQKRKTSKVIAFLMSFAMVFAMMPSVAFAAPVDNESSAEASLTHDGTVTYYDSFYTGDSENPGAIDEAQDGDSVTLLSDITPPNQKFDGNEIVESESIIISDIENLTIDLNGKSIVGTNKYTGDALSAPTGTTGSKVPSGILSIHNASVTLKDSAGGSELENLSTALVPVITNNPATLTINDGIAINGNKNITGIKIYTGGESHVTINDCNITAGNPFTPYVGKNYTDSSLTINGGVFTSFDNSNKGLFGNTTTTKGYACGTIIVNDGTFIAKGGSLLHGSSFPSEQAFKGGKFYGMTASLMSDQIAEGHVAIIKNNDSMSEDLPGETYFEIKDSDADCIATTMFSRASGKPEGEFGIESGMDLSNLILTSSISSNVTRTIEVKDNATLNVEDFGGDDMATDNLVLNIASGKTVTGNVTTKMAKITNIGEGTLDINVSPSSAKYEVSEIENGYESNLSDNNLVAINTHADGTVTKYSETNVSKVFSSTQVKTGDTIKLFKDIEYPSAIYSANDMTIDLNGHKVLYTGASAIMLSIQSKTVSIVDTSADKGSEIDGTSASNSAIWLGSTTGSKTAWGNLTIGEGVTIKGCVVTTGKSQLDVYGSVIFNTAGDYPFNSNTSYGNEEQRITLHDGSLVQNTESIAIYKPQAGKLIVEDGAKIVGKTNAIKFRQGELIINGGEFEAAEGDAVIIESGSDKGYPLGVSSYITGGKFIAPDGNKAINSTIVSGSSDEPLTGFIASSASGAVITSNQIPAEYLAEGFASEEDGNGNWTVTGTAVASVIKGDHETYFTSFESAFAAMEKNSGDVLNLLEDYDGTYHMDFDEVFYVKKNSHKFNTPKVDGEYAVLSNVQNGVTEYSAQEAVWEITKDGETSYTTNLQSVLSHPGSDLTCKLLKDDISIPRTCIGSVFTPQTNVTIDLNGKTLTSSNTDSDWSALYFHSSVSNGTLTMKNGTFEVPTQSSNAIHIRAGQTVNLEDDLTINSGADIVYIEGEGATLNTKATLNGTGTYGIAGNGSNGKGGTVINIMGGSVKASAVAIYHPQWGQLNISDGNIEAEGCALYAKSGQIAISGGNLKATADKSDYEYNGSGCNPTGDAVVIDNCNYPGGAPAVSVTGGFFDSLCASAIGSYANGEQEPAKAFVSGGEFRGDFDSALCVDGKMPQKDPNTGIYSIVNGEVAAECDGYYYSDIQSALEYGTNGHVVTLYKDYIGTYRIPAGTTLVMNKNGHTFKTPVADGPFVVNTLVNDGIYTYTLSEASWEASDPDGNVTYSNSLQSLLSSPVNGRVIKPLADNLEINRTCIGSVLSRSVNVTLDLNGKTVKSANTKSDWSALYFHTSVLDGTLTIKNGTFDVPSQSANAIHIRAGQTVNLESDLTINSGCDAIFIEGEGATLNTGARIISSGNYGIAGNGSNGKGGTVVNINGGEILAADVGVYQPQSGVLNISGGNIEAGTAVYIKSGELNMNDGQIHSTGEASDYRPMSSGCSPTGDGIVIDNAGYPGGAPTVSITGGKVLSDNAKAVASYAPENSEVISKFIKGGEFSSDVTELCVPCFTASENGTGMYEVAFDPEAVNEALEELENKLAEQQEFLDALDDTFASDEELSQKLEEAKEAIQAAQEAVDQAQNTAMTENVANLQTAINNALAAMSEADEQVLVTAKAYIDSEIASIKDQVDANKAALDALDETYATDSSVSNAIEEAKSQIEQAQEAIDNAQNTALSQNVQALTNAINEAKQAAADADASTLSAAKSYADSIAEGLQNQINAQKDILDSLDNEYAKDADVASAIAQAKDAIETAQSAIDATQDSALSDKVQELTQAINDARQAAQTANESTLTATKGYADTLASGLQNQIDAHQSFLDNLNDTYAKDDDVASAIQTAKESIESAQALKDALQDASLDNLADAITEAKEAASSANADTLAAAKAYTNEVKDALQGQITDNKNALDSLDDEYAKDADVASAIADAKEAIENAQALVNELNNTKMSELSQAVQEAMEAVSGSNEETLIAAKAYTDAKAAQLQSQIDDLQDKLDKLAEETATNNTNNVNVSIAAKAKNYNTVVVSWNTSKITVDGNKVVCILYS